jgi:mono/diheme cytochrome c family protein
MWIRRTSILAGMILLLVSCSPATSPAPTPTVDAVAAGRQLFPVKGCAACHGEDAQGTELGPPVGGHAAEAVIRQVRTATGAMPASGVDRITDQELAYIAAFVADQPSMATELGTELTEAEREHLMETLEALESGDQATALEHMRIAASIASGDNQEAFEHWAEEIEEGKLSMVEHEL